MPSKEISAEIRKTLKAVYADTKFSVVLGKGHQFHMVTVSAATDIDLTPVRDLVRGFQTSNVFVTVQRG
jgi:hypothetical protein